MILNDVNSPESWEQLLDMPDIPELDELLGRTASMLQLKRQMYNLARTDNPLLLLGESGTGKTHMARIIHRLSTRDGNPFFAVNMAAIPESLAEAELFGTVAGAYTGAVNRKGFFSAADGGTLFLDEIGELSLGVQSKLLHVLEDKIYSKVGSAETRRCNVRFLFATNTDLHRLMDDHRFRVDLYYRISAFPVVIPPLRDRKADIPILAEHFLRPHQKMLSETGMQKLCDYHWPGNIRELKNCLSRASVAAGGEVIRDWHISF